MFPKRVIAERGVGGRLEEAAGIAVLQEATGRWVVFKARLAREVEQAFYFLQFAMRSLFLSASILRRVDLMKTWKMAVLGVAAIGFSAMSANAGELDIMKPRVTADQIAAAKAMKPPFAVTADMIAKGKDVFTGAGTCYTCHGSAGDGNGPGAAGMDPAPRNFTNSQFEQVRTAGEMFWVVSNGSPLQPAMVGFVTAGQITEKQAWEAVIYERSLGCKGDMDCVEGSAAWVAKQPVHESSAGNLTPEFLNTAAK